MIHPLWITYDNLELPVRGKCYKKIIQKKENDDFKMSSLKAGKSRAYRWSKCRAYRQTVSVSDFAPPDF